MPPCIASCPLPLIVPRGHIPGIVSLVPEACARLPPASKQKTIRQIPVVRGRLVSLNFLKQALCWKYHLAETDAAGLLPKLPRPLRKAGSTTTVEAAHAWLVVSSAASACSGAPSGTPGSNHSDLGGHPPLGHTGAL